MNISGLIEIPAYGVTLPIGDVWDAKEVASFPRRFYGSAYDGSLIVGGADQDGQFDFCDQINPEAHIYVTDMTGTEFEYHVTRIDRAKEINLEKLMNHYSSKPIIDVFNPNLYLKSDIIKLIISYLTH